MLVDAHVHIRAEFNLETFLDAASANFRDAAARLGRVEDPLGALMLAEVSNACVFTRLREECLAEDHTRRWRSTPTKEASSLILHRDDGCRLILIAGRQCISAEGLEVLALATTEQYEDGRPIDRLLKVLNTTDALVVLPWGLGKWIGKRGRIVRRIIESHQGGRLYVGDNSGRPALCGTPFLLRHAASRGIRTLPGTDALPLPQHERCVGQYGFVVDRSVNMTQPTASIRTFLDDVIDQPTTYGRLSGLVQCVKTQLNLRMRRRSKRHASSR